MRISSNIKAAALIVLAMAMISSNDAIVKTVSEELGIGQILFIRGTMACLILGMMINFSGRPLFPKNLFSRVNLLRASLETAATLCFVTGLSLLPIATASALVWTSPLLLTLLASLLLQERVLPARWAAVALGFVGMLLVVQPFGSQFSEAMGLPLMAALFVAARDVVTRRIDPGLHSLYVTFATLALVTLSGAVLASLSWQPVRVELILFLALSACLLTGGFFSHVTAVRMGELSFISPFSFSGIVVAIMLGYLIWHDVPTPIMLTGIALIIGSCWYIARSHVPKRIDEHHSMRQE